MVFSSLVFLFGFLPLFLLTYAVVPGLRSKNVVVTLWSYVFYAWWRPDFVLLMLFSTLVDWFCSIRMGEAGEARSRKPWLLVSMVTNLGLLAWFKYANLVVGTLQDAGMGPSVWEDVVLPVGISFYTFQSMSYTIDVYRGEVKPVRSILDLACYVSMFPQLVAGPIVRYRDVQEQLVERRHSVELFATGAALFMVGMVKKVLIADHVSLIADPVFAATAPGFLDAWLGVLAFAIQIYFDFSGYSDMAVGLGLLIGFKLPMNFDSPYHSASITEFWRRWHISLSTWLRDYLYVPLGGNRYGEVRTYCNLATTMLLGGLWHGAQWKFLAWGAYQGGFLILERLMGKRAPWGFLPKPLQVLVTFAIVLGGWAVFQARDMSAAVGLWTAMLGTQGLGEVPTATSHPEEAWIALLVGVGIAFFGVHSWRLVRGFRTTTLVWLFVLFVVAVMQLAARSHNPFLYFHF
jgi:alginate O-acetyltransferase complex protein AlgI